jgi:hypothetical protein
VDFALPGSPFPRGTLDLDRAAPNGAGPARWPAEAIVLVADSAADVRLTQAAEVFGAWRRQPPPPDGLALWVVRFDEPYRDPAAPGGSRALTVTADLADDPARGDARVLRVTLFRDE